MPDIYPKFDFDAGKWSVLTDLKPCETYNIILDKKAVKRARLTGMLFDANKSFLLPQDLPGIKTIIDMHKSDPKAELLIIGHAGGDEDLKGADIAFDRAQI